MRLIKTATSISANTTQKITFEDRVLTLTILWNEPAGSFFLSIEDGLGGSIQGIRMVENYLLLAQNKAFIDFSGDILVIREDNEVGGELTYDNFGNGWNPYLITADEAATWRADNGL
ncbi:MAG: hypothetical protein KAR06_10480 [Deltaproteobacteria bacterium]|nr:hypothetical protein [Deltaproteobacteria bacterium]